MIKECKQCKKEFNTKHRTRCCSRECEKIYKQFYNIQWQKDNPEKTKEINQRVQRKRVQNGKSIEYSRKRRKSKDGYCDRFMERVKLRTPDSDITREYLLNIFGDQCVISGISFEYEKSYDAYHNALAPSIDRIDNKQGYYIGNVQIILSCLNRMKNDMPNEQFLKLWSALVD